MGLRFRNKKDVDQYLREFSVRIEKALLYALEYMVAELQNHAKLNGAYNDVTSNLRSSVGGVILKDGKPLTYKGFEGVSTGITTGKSFINSLIPEFSQVPGFIVILVAGMEYASYVENYHNLNVLKATELKMYRDMPKMMSVLKSKIEKLG